MEYKRHIKFEGKISIRHIAIGVFVFACLFDTVYDSLSPSSIEVKQILYQEWQSRNIVNNNFLRIEEQSFGRRGIKLLIGKRYILSVKYISTEKILPINVIEQFNQEGYILQKQQGNPENEAVYEFKKVNGFYKDNLSCVVYIINNNELVLNYQYRT